MKKSARIAAQEATAEGLNWTFSPMVDIARDPRWGRISEGNGEDPFLGSAIARAMVKGYRGGFVVTDYTAINEMTQHGLGDLQTVSALALKAGVEMDMVGEGLLTTLKKSLDEGKLKMADIDLACRRILEAKYKMGLFEDPYRRIDPSRPAKEVLTPENRKAAREIAANGFVTAQKREQHAAPAENGQNHRIYRPHGRQSKGHAGHLGHCWRAGQGCDGDAGRQKCCSATECHFQQRLQYHGRHGLHAPTQFL
ncbi:MAG: hypothetical protein IPN76_35470 [Saprospiraceae bacterium]|nr:hypothetical protein [Saprospiraceae bacterium]